MPHRQRPLLEIAGQSLDHVVKSPSGRHPTLVFLHEGLGSIELWRSFPADLVAATGHRGLVYSRSGHGWSEEATTVRPLSFFDHEALDVLPPLLTRLDAPDPILIGHSDGASISLVYAAHHRPTALVLLAPHVFVEDHGLAEIRDITASWPDGKLEERMARYHRNPAATFRAWSEFWLHPEFANWNIEQILGGIECPVLVIQGLEDPYGTVAHADSIERGVSGPVVRLELEACGHSPHLSQPAKTLEAMTHFIADVSA